MCIRDRYQAEKIDGKKVHRLKIHYNCIGAIEIPDLSKLPENNVSEMCIRDRTYCIGNS